MLNENISVNTLAKEITKALDNGDDMALLQLNYVLTTVLKAPLDNARKHICNTCDIGNYNNDMLGVRVRIGMKEKTHLDHDSMVSFLSLDELKALYTPKDTDFDKLKDMGWDSQKVNDTKCIVKKFDQPEKTVYVEKMK